MDIVFAWLIGTLIPLLLSSWLLSSLTEVSNGLLYNCLIILFLALSVLYVVRLPKSFGKIKKENREILEKDEKMVSVQINKLESFNLNLSDSERVSETPLSLSLDEQYEYVQTIQSDDSFEKKENQIEEKMKSLTQKMEEIDWVKFKKRESQDFRWVRWNILNEEYEKRIEDKLQLRNNSHVTLSEKIKELGNKLETFKKEKNNLIWSINQGVHGEKRIVDDMKLMLTDGHILESVRIEHMGRSAESDIVYVGSTGIHSLEIKNFGAKGNWNIHISRDGQWQKVFPNGNREAMKDVGNQMNYHIAVKERFLHEKLKEKYGESAPKIKINAAIVIANDTVIIDNESDLPVLRLSSLYRYLDKEHSQLSKEWQERITETLKEYKKSGKPYEVANFQAKMENLLLETEHISNLFDLRYGWLQKMQTEFTPTSEVLENGQTQSTSNNAGSKRYLGGKLSGLEIVTALPLLFVSFYAWIYRNFLGFGQAVFQEVTLLEKVTSVALVLFLVIAFMFVVPSYYKWDEQTEKQYRKEMKERLKSHEV